MWPQDYSARLQAWADLRNHCIQSPLVQALTEIDAWWQQTPWQPYYLHWDDRDRWPTPWELLSDNIYCDLARALGIMYTVSMIERDDITAVELADTDQGNLVLVNQRKYILNWHTSDKLNIPSKQFTINQRLNRRAIHHLTDR
jgi:hypothetical protein